MKMVKKKKLENLNKKHNQYIRSLGIMIDVDSGNNLMLLPLDKMMDQGNKFDINQLRLRGDSDE